MPTTIYSGKVLLTPTYCRKEIDQLTDRYHLMSPPFWGEKAEKRDRILNSLSYYEEIQKSLNDLENLSLDELLKFIAQQIAWKIKEHSFHCINFLWETPLLIFTHTLFYLVFFLYCYAFQFFQFQMYMFLLLQRSFLYFLLLFYHIFLVLY